jgi:hypothetical protein
MHFFMGHIFHVEWHFKFSWEVEKKLGHAINSCLQTPSKVTSWQAIYAKSEEKNTYEPS